MGGLPEIVADGETGVVVPAGDAPALARAIVDLARDPARVRALGEAARRRATAQFSAAAAADRIDSLYRTMFQAR